METDLERTTPGKVGGPRRQQRFNFVALTVAVLVAAMGLGYLIAIPLGWIDPGNRRLSASETALFGAILVFTLMLLLITGPGLEGFSVSGKGFDIRLRKVQDEVTSLRFLLSQFLVRETTRVPDRPRVNRWPCIRLYGERRRLVQTVF
jgi:hypothetical protein